MFQLALKAGKWIGHVLALPFTTMWKRSSTGVLSWLAHAGLLVLALVGLWWLNQWLRLDMAVQAPSLVLRQLWLPLMFLVAYGMAWCIWSSWLAWRQPGPLSPFPDIQEAWNAAQLGLAEHDLSLTELPVVLLLGTTTSSEQDVLASLEIDSSFGPRPSQHSAPVRVMADEQAIYISAPGVSSVAAQTERWYEKRQFAPQAKAASQNAGVQSEVALVEQAIPASLKAASAGGVATAEVVPATRSDSDMGVDIDQVESQIQSALEGEGDWLFESCEDTQRAEEVTLVESTISTQTCDSMRARLAYLASLVREARQGRAPFDGVSLFVPGDALSTSCRADLMSSLVRGDLDTLSDSSGSIAPVVCVVTDLDDVEGCSEVLQRLPACRQQLLLGSELPLESGDDDHHQPIASKLESIGSELIPALCSRLYEVGNAPSKANQRLFSFQHNMALRQANLNALVGNIATKCRAHWSIAGCYLVATGHFDPATRGFGGRVLSRLLDLTGRAKWTDKAIEADRTNRRWANYTWGTAAAIGGFAVLVLFI
ncbi:type VI secretion protein IcmF/TssM N-terminal domain-containing protein [Aeoliella sp.]|uniref:type VI secretion protein IcmF/TssM N-terminal domain-containing protein n=1 Tax=Aeoliella sp. TaxID=2795800 RepID=UPI003CCBA46B